MKYTICPVTTNKYSDDGTMQNDGYTIVNLVSQWDGLVYLYSAYLIIRLSHTVIITSLSRLVCQLNGGVSSDRVKLSRRVSTFTVKVDTRLTMIREINARWINELFYIYLFKKEARWHKERPRKVGRNLCLSIRFRLNSGW